MLRKIAFREISKSLGRYIAILAIIALGVGFFAGLRTTREAMMLTCNDYLKEHKFYDFQLVSTLGYDDDSVDALKKVKGVKAAEGSYTADVLVKPLEKSKSGKKENDIVIKFHSITDKLNTLKLEKGRMPENNKECVIDYEYAKGKDLIGKKIHLTEGDNDTAGSESPLKSQEYTITGLVQSPYYLNVERGTTSKGTGVVTCFAYVEPSAFTSPAYSEVFVKTDSKAPIHSADYKADMKKIRPEIKKAALEAADSRYAKVQAEVLQMIAGFSPAIMGSLPSVEKPETFVLHRDTNIGYVSFDNDTGIINEVSTVFPIFFLLVAALVCMTTMARIVEDHRTQIGVLKAQGYSNMQVMNIYLWYSGSAAFIGATAGFFIGILIIPYVIWKSYTIMYDFADSIHLLIDWKLGISSIVIAVALSLATTVFATLNDMKETPAQLIRPKSPKAGRRILLERIPFIWNRLGFLYKISFRNIFRYRKRLFMMVLGISGCTALLLTGFGLKDSISDIVPKQYDEISHYSYTVSFKDSMSPQEQKDFVDSGNDIKEAKFANMMTAKVIQGKQSKAIRLVTTTADNFSSYVDLHMDGIKVAFPKDGEVIVSQRCAEDFNLKKGDTITFRTDSLKEAKLKVSGVFENYIYTYAYINPTTYEEKFREEPDYNTAFVITKSDKHDVVYESAAKVQNMKNVTSVTLNDEFRSRVDSMLGSLHSVILLVVAAAGALAFIVLYNLTNINITERIREIATIKVLGFYPRETSAYVFRENFFLTLMGAVLGLILGKLLHTFVMAKIKVDMIAFPTVIRPVSYLIAVGLTFLFAVLVMFIMYFKIKKISMTESLKSVE